MAPVRNGRHIFNEVPTGYPVPGQTTVYDGTPTIDLDAVPLEGGILVKTLVLSLDPYMRGRMRAPGKKSYNVPFTLGASLNGFGVGKVLRSDAAGIKTGDYVYGNLPFEEYSVKKEVAGLRILKNEEKLPWSVYVGAAGMAGKTAYLAWKAYASPKKDDTVFISAGAGIVGSLVAQYAKLDGVKKVISSAGSDEKIEYLKEIGVDVAFNYKTQDTAEILAKEGPIDIYWDNVGGPTLEAAIENTARHARLIECGMSSQYNATEPYAIKNLSQVVTKALHIHGFIVTFLEADNPAAVEEFYKTIPGKLARGEIKYREDITRGLEKVGEAFDDMMRGRNQGKSVIWVADD